MNFFSFLFFCILICSCGNQLKEQDNTSNQTVTSGLVAKSMKDTVSQNIFGDLVSGSYGDISLAFGKDNVLTGVYEYYDNWDENSKEYANINVFYFYGEKSGDSVFVIHAGWPGNDQSLSGKLVYGNVAPNPYIKVILNDQPNGYNDVDFTDSAGVKTSLTKSKKWIEVRLVKSVKARVYNSADSSTIRKGYLVKNDVLKLISKQDDGWDQVEYNPKGNDNKSSIFWIKEDDLYNVDSSKW
ncbi:hypothetical protein [Pinibacter soli]|uniref:SH3 domain-containing protein n=1 Tax=Pinibacter soli TaxID=3044211 RepID=A0ABT6R9V0_9BACT|nr:hypothetical protein [Pinibacter soli]MDI3319191.1 hypothetical protein [Pinibacter soli]